MTYEETRVILNDRTSRYLFDKYVLRIIHRSASVPQTYILHIDIIHIYVAHIFTDTYKNAHIYLYTLNHCRVAYLRSSAQRKKNSFVRRRENNCCRGRRRICDYRNTIYPRSVTTIDRKRIDDEIAITPYFSATNRESSRNYCPTIVYWLRPARWPVVRLWSLHRARSFAP